MCWKWNVGPKIIKCTPKNTANPLWMPIYYLSLLHNIIRTHLWIFKHPNYLSDYKVYVSLHSLTRSSYLLLSSSHHRPIQFQFPNANRSTFMFNLSRELNFPDFPLFYRDTTFPFLTNYPILLKSVTCVARKDKQVGYLGYPCPTQSPSII